MKKKIIFLFVFMTFTNVAFSAEKVSVKKSSVSSKVAPGYSLYLMPFGTEVRSARDERGTLTSQSNTSMAVGFGFKDHELWFEKQSTKKSDSSSGALSVRNKSDEMSLTYRFVLDQRIQALRFSVGVGILQRDQSSVSELQGTQGSSSVQDKAPSIYEPLLMASVSGKLSVFFYDLALKSLFIKGADPSPTLALQAKAGLSFSF